MGTFIKINEAIKIGFNVDVSYLDAVLLDGNGRYKPVEAKVLAGIEQDDLLVWATNHSLYQLVTTEMVDWLKEQIGDRSAIEIGAGNGAICHALGITGTDSYLQQREEVKLFYKLSGVPETNPPKDVQKLDALTAVRKFRPHTVVGAFITQHGTMADRERGIPCNPEGVKEWEMLMYVKRYICFGNKNPHSQKRIFHLPHKEYQFDWLYTRAFDQSLNRIWVWG